MKVYNAKDKPIKVFGIPFFEEKKVFERIPKQLREEISNLEFLGRRCPGARVCFRTDATEFTVKITFKTLSFDIGMSIYACQSASVMVGNRQNSVFLGLVNPPDYDTRTFEKTFNKSDKLEDVTIWLPRNEELDNIEISFPDSAQVEEPTPYKYGPALYYGSSITEGGCCCNVTNGYNAILSRLLDLDYYNFGFSGSAQGEIAMAEYICTIDFNVFVYDYDYNAPNAEHLRKTHEPFFKTIRKNRPDVPIIMLSRPNFDYSVDGAERREIIENTYKNALSDGDKNVYFIDGETFFGEEDRELCTVDTIHPNDLGFYRMAQTILPVMKKIIEK